MIFGFHWVVVEFENEAFVNTDRPRPSKATWKRYDDGKLPEYDQIGWTWLDSSPLHTLWIHRLSHLLVQIRLVCGTLQLKLSGEHFFFVPSELTTVTGTVRLRLLLHTYLFHHRYLSQHPFRSHNVGDDSFQLLGQAPYGSLSSTCLDKSQIARTRYVNSDLVASK